MKKTYFAAIFLSLAAVVLFAFSPQRLGSVKGSVTPVDGASQVWLITAKDTLRSGIQNGVFQVTGVKPGTCTLVVEGISPYRQTVRTGVEVFEGTETNVGEIILEKAKKSSAPLW
ncbi:peptidase associated/transthyretin-like domain-containing protein [Sediminibacterium soli]|uniref:carboxypeptidase-like regulatory domain-containing protein n=1 Tax=Sediminibacterium soli TaxID=2698829 RepID=UPI00137997BE|nr:carboxypeptidase-like regulatory domain-containing protein [Sediminibacterium soli]NCI46136.1 carboxypeptidase regulatory-like domain-containing protein [Sediminibacterium soli]